MNLVQLQKQNQQLIEENRRLKAQQATHLKLIHNKDKTLQDKNNELQDKDTELQRKESTVNTQRQRIQQLLEQLAQARQQRFGRSSEQLNPHQLSLFDEAEHACDDDALESAPSDTDSITVKPHRRKKRGRVALPDDLPREERIYDLSAEQRICPHDGTSLKAIGEASSEQLDIVPAQVKVIRHICKKYACPHCQSYIVTARKPKQPIESSIASAGLLAHVITSKYQDSLPLHRQETIFRRIGVDLKRNTLANWMIHCGTLIQPLINALSDRLLEQPIIHMDETPVRVLRPEQGSSTKKHYMWVQRAGPPDKSYHDVIFHYADSRSGAVAEYLLSGYRGTIMVDGYSAYNQLKSDEIQRLGCWAHARRKFHEAKQAQPKGKSGKADQALAWIQKLYAIEKQVMQLDTEPERRAYRQQHSKPVVDKLNQWREKNLLITPPETALGKALVYLTNQWNYLSVYIEHGDYPIDNNPAENAIRPFVLGRKNWLFSNSTRGAKASANLYSLIETAKAHQVEPHAYLKWVLEKLPQMEDLNNVEQLLPDQFKNLKSVLN